MSTGSKKKNIHSEHTYNKQDKCQDLQGPNTDSCAASEVNDVLEKQPLDTLTQTLDKELSDVSRKGKNVLFMRDVKMLSNSSLFINVIKEMKEACAQLFEILITCIGE